MSRPTPLWDEIFESLRAELAELTEADPMVAIRANHESLDVLRRRMAPARPAENPFLRVELVVDIDLGAGEYVPMTRSEFEEWKADQR